MTAGRHQFPMLVWAAREIQRRPGRTALLFCALASLVFMVATALLFSRALETTWSRLVEKTPDLVVRRIDAGGWAPIPVDQAVAGARAIPGILDPTPRLWGVAAVADGPVTVITSPASLPAGRLAATPQPASGQAVVGLKVMTAVDNGRLTLAGRNPVTVSVIGTFPADTGLATHDLVWMTPDDARRLLGIPAGHASDLALYLFRREEEKAVQADLAAAFPWPVSIVDRSTSALHLQTRAVRTGALAMVVGIPALLALLLIVASVVVDGSGRQSHQGLCRALGWSTSDLLRLQLFKALIVGLPAVLGGLAGAYLVVFSPPLAGVTAFWITGGQHLPALVLTPDGALLVMLEVAVMAGLPYLATVFLTTLRGTATDVWPRTQVASWN